MRGGMDIQLTGAAALIFRLNAAKVGGRTSLAAALYREALRIFATSQRLVPVATGALKSSGYVDTPRMSGGDAIEILIGYGGSAAPYGIYVHERLDLQHRSPTQAKFLEQPVLEASRDIGTRLGRDLRLFVGRL